MVSALYGGRRLGAVIVAIGLLLASTGNAFAHARYDRSEPADGATVDGQPFVLAAYFTQELTSKSTLRVIDANGVQVDFGDGHVDLNDLDCKIMYVSLPELPVGTYTVQYVAQSAEDGHDEPGTFTFNVGSVPPSGGAPSEQPADGAATAPADGTSALPCEDVEGVALDAY